jgi:protein phosphatase PTC7
LDAQRELARLFADVLVAYGRMGMQRTGLEEGWKTPFELEAAKEGKRYEGGKVDE